MRKFLLIFSFIFFIPLLFSQQADSQFKKVYMDIRMGKSQVKMLTTFYVFNDISEGDNICRKLFNFEKFNEAITKEKFTKLTYISPDSELLKYEYSVMKNGFELWIFRNKGDGWLWGKGFTLYKPGDSSE